MHMVFDLFRHYLLSRRGGALIKVVSLISIFAVGIGIFSLIVVISVMNGFNRSYKSRLFSVEPHLVLSASSKTSDFESLQQTQAFSELKKIKEASSTELTFDLFESQELIIRTERGYFGGGLGQGLDIDALRKIQMTSKKDQILQSQPENDLRPGEVWIGSGLANSLDISPGDTLTVLSPEVLLLPAGEVPTFEKVIVRDTLNTNISDIDTKMIYYVREKTFRKMRDSASRQVGIEVRVPDPDHIDSLVKTIRAAGGLEVATWVERNSNLFYALRLEKISIATFLSLSTMIAGFSIVTVLTLLLASKQKDIGMLMAMGMSRRRTQRLFFAFGLLLSSIGSLGGTFAAVIFCWLLERFPLDIMPAVYTDHNLSAEINLTQISFINVIAFCLAAMSLSYPVRHAVRGEPALALHGKNRSA